ncbi:MAG: hypothetical protein ACXADH_01610 [Candidatus Kariarchaeaceae archaeon]|jgi:uncharacterized membrane protein YebE (DUF533 family)
MPDREKIPYETSLSSLLLSVVRQAQADGIITADEGELINRIQIDARDFEAEVAKAAKAGVTSLQEIFHSARERMVKNATETAKRDGIITEDEEAIINELISQLENVQFK